jgi:enamine deaminase RidA (YjgF/YER057c/UK114 family)
MKTSLFLFILTTFLTGCVCLDPAHHKSVPPSVQTQKVVESLKNIRTSLDQAGEENATVEQKLTKAITLAEKLDVLLEQLDTMFSQGKSTIKPE